MSHPFTPSTMRHETDPVHCDAASIAIRRAETADIPALLAIEEQSFPTDRMTPRNFRYAIHKAKGMVLVADCQGRAAAYGVVAFRTGSLAARLTSFAVDPGRRNLGIARRLLAGLEEGAAVHGCTGMRLEVRADNLAALRLYASAGYRRFAVRPDYYEDGMTALRLEKAFATAHQPNEGGKPSQA
ncbi:GNAT family N-acetyltransferase [Azospirillum picis]|uniref:Ribosomal protein S18 acetylase RimI-like enzyme n=1 Tax=Azospirillum picis TaxID=488438 RepID=A0ABU0MG67_9PROT|nr:GNAT family N-acetyltransferase [Azospirillum picis]MBP2298524.1 ribosomal protein S18 acetylase RimI-like enzyme [Azospirillum picis]MDQ0532427.1 ribosomal protein S18 acetylase RimI-like enzyme [Azospirillum picis]